MEMVLASASPRRRELLALAGFSFSVCPSGVDETLEEGVSGEQAVQLLAQRKAEEVTEVVFYPLSEREIAGYIATGEPMDKAGAYGIQGKGALLVREIHGDYYNVVGFPISKFCRVYRNFLSR